MSRSDTAPSTHVLRAELRLKKKLAQQVGQPVVAGHLADPAFYRRLGDLWLEHFESIEFSRTHRMIVPATIPDLSRGLALSGVNAIGGAEAIIHGIDAGRKAGIVTHNQATRMRKWIRELVSHPHLTEEVDVAVEFRTAINAVHQTTRAYRPH